MSGLRVVTGPAVEPVTLGEAQQWLRENGSDPGQDDILEQVLIPSLRRHAEESICKRAFVQQTLEESFDYWPCETNIVCLQRPPLISISSITYIDLYGNTLTIDPTAYQVDTVSQPGRVKPVYNQFWPLIRSSDFNPIRIQYVAGYAPDANDSSVMALRKNVPPQLKQWIYARLALHYDNRCPIIMGGLTTEVPRAYADGMLDSLIVDLF